MLNGGSNMYSITTVFKNKGRCFVVDSKDGVSESYTFPQIRDFVEKRGIDIKGYKKGNIFTYSEVAEKLVGMQKGTPLQLNIDGNTYRLSLYAGFDMHTQEFLFFDGEGATGYYKLSASFLAYHNCKLITQVNPTDYAKLKAKIH